MKLQARKQRDARLSKARVAAPLRAPAMRAEASVHEIQRFLRSPAYNKAFAGGHQSSGIVPLPAMSAGKQPRAYMPCKGTTSTVASVAGGESLVIGFCPYSAIPVVGAFNLGAMNNKGVNWRQDYPGPNFEDASGALTTVLGNWIGVTDPRTLVSNYEGNYVAEFNPANDDDPLLLQQFMGGSVNLTVTAGWDTTGRVGVIDGKSFPTFYGTKLPPFSTLGEKSDGTPIAGYINVPDQEDTFQWFDPNAYFNATSPQGVLSTIQNSSLVGGSETSAAHISFNLVPEGTRWAPWSGNFTPGVAAGCNATLGGVPAFNWAPYVMGGYQLIIIVNDGAAGSSPITVRLNSQLFYNVHIPTHGAKSVPVLAAGAPITRPHPADATSVHSVPMISHESSMHASAAHTHASLVASRNAGMDDAHLYITTPPTVVPSSASKATGAAEAGAVAPVQSLIGGLLKNVAPKDVLSAVEKPETLLSKLDPSKLLSDPSSIIDAVGALF